MYQKGPQQNPMAAPFGRQPSQPVADLQANGQAVNRASLLSGLRHDSQIKPNTGTATGDRAAQDFAKSQLYQNQAALGRKSDMANAKMQSQMQQQQEAMTQQMRQSRMQRFQQNNQQAADQAQLGLRLGQHKWDMWMNWRSGLARLLG